MGDGVGDKMPQYTAAQPEIGLVPGAEDHSPAKPMAASNRVQVLSPLAGYCIAEANR